MFIKDRTGFLISRLVLGFCESGYIPGAIYTLSTWYTKHELARRVAIFFFGMFSGNAISPLLATGILKLDNVRGLRGWQWLFLSMSPLGRHSRHVALTLPVLVEGLFTIFVSFIILFFLPTSPEKPKPLLRAGIVKFTESDTRVLQARLEDDDQGKKPGAQGMHISLEVVWKTVSHYQRWPHFISTFAAFSTWSPLTTYTPSIMM